MQRYHQLFLCLHVGLAAVTTLCPIIAQTLPRFQEMGLSHRLSLIMMELVWLMPIGMTYSKVNNTSRVTSSTSVAVEDLP